jgi:hypothetical protein
MRRIPQITKVEPVGEYCLHLTFDDGAEGEIDISKLIKFRGVFEPLRDLREFERVFVDADGGTIAWPNGADLDPIVLYAAVTKQSVESLLASTAVR